MGMCFLGAGLSPVPLHGGMSIERGSARLALRMGRQRKRGNPTDLNTREQEVFALIRKELTNPEIAERLGLSLETVKHHVSQILAKLDVADREEAAAWQSAPRVERRLGVLLTVLVRTAAATITASALVGVGFLGYGVISRSGAASTDSEALTSAPSPHATSDSGEARPIELTQGSPTPNAARALFPVPSTNGRTATESAPSISTSGTSANPTATSVQPVLTPSIAPPPSGGPLATPTSPPTESPCQDCTTTQTPIWPTLPDKGTLPPDAPTAIPTPTPTGLVTPIPTPTPALAMFQIAGVADLAPIATPTSPPTESPCDVCTLTPSPTLRTIPPRPTPPADTQTASPGAPTTFVVTPTPLPAALPATGGAPSGTGARSWWLAFGLLMVGSSITAIAWLGARRKRDAW